MQIDNGIAPPAKRQWKADLDSMRINQSAQLSLKFYNSVKTAISLHFHRQTPKAFTTAKLSPTHFRVWRVK